MCGICGCGEEDTNHNVLSHTHDHDLVKIEQDIFAKNNKFAETNRHYFRMKNILSLNLMSSPGAGKTTLLVRTITDLKHRFNIATIEGDQHTRLDAERIEAAGATAIQINTGKSCHLDAHQVGHAAEKLALHDQTILFIENVGNLVCPSLFDLGEAYKVAILSVTEGEDKPLKYPDMFRAADIVLLNKIDLLPYLEFDVAKCTEYMKRINPKTQVFELSAKNGTGMDQWYHWLELNYKNLTTNND